MRNADGCQYHKIKKIKIILRIKDEEFTHEHNEQMY